MVNPVTPIQPGITRIRLPMFGKKPGPVNVYLFQGGNNISLIDTGTFLSARILKRRLAGMQIKFSDIDQIVLTHGHLDHQGAVRTIAKHNRRQIKVCAHRDEIAAIEAGTDAPMKAYHRFLKITGTPVRHRLAIETMMLWGQRLTRAYRVDRPLENGDRLRLGSHEATVIATPGHTRGSISIFLEKQGLIFSGDHILDHITPNALPMLEQDSSLPVRLSQKEYFDSLDTIAKLNPKVIHPAHGAQIHDFHAIHDVYRDCFRRRQNAILRIIRQREGQSIYMIARKLFPQVRKKAFVLDLYLALCEAFTHLQVLESDGFARMDRENKIVKVGAL